MRGNQASRGISDSSQMTQAETKKDGEIMTETYVQDMWGKGRKRLAEEPSSDGKIHQQEMAKPL